MAIATSKTTFTSHNLAAAVGVLGMLFAGCKSHGVGRIDAAADAPVANATSTGTGTAAGTGTMANTGPGTSSATSTQANTGPGTASATATVNSTATVTASGPPETGSRTAISTSTVTSTVATSNRTATSTTTATGTVTSSTLTASTTSTGTATGTGATWTQIKVARTNGLAFCPVDGTAATVFVRRNSDGSFVLSGEAFRKTPGETEGCYTGYADSCFKKQTFPDTVLTSVQRDQLMNLVAAMPPGRCTSKGNVDPCILTTLSIDSLSDTDWGSWGCVEDDGPGTHLAGERAIVAYIDSLVPGKVPAGVDAAVVETAPAVERPSGPCDIYADAKTPCAAAYSMVRALSKSYLGPLFQVRAGSSSRNNTMSGGTTKDIMPGPDGFVEAATVDEACGSTYCTVSVLYDHSGNGNNLKRAPKGNTAISTEGQDDYESIATGGPVTVGGRWVYSLFMNEHEGYRTPSGVVGKGMPTGSQDQSIYMLADGTRNAYGCCWEFGNVTTNPTELAFDDALFFGSSVSKGGAGTGPWFRADLGLDFYPGERGPGIYFPEDLNPSLKVPFALGLLKVYSEYYVLKVVDLSTSNNLRSVSGDSVLTVNHQGGIVLGVGANNANGSSGTFYEGAIVAGYPSENVDLAVQKNIKSVGYWK